MEEQPTIIPRKLSYLNPPFRAAQRLEDLARFSILNWIFLAAIALVIVGGFFRFFGLFH